MKRLALVLLAVLLGGCGVKRQMVQLTPPELHVNAETGPAIVVGDIRDTRKPVEGLAGKDPAKNVGGVIRGGNGIAVDLKKKGVRFIIDAVDARNGVRFILPNAVNEPDPFVVSGQVHSICGRKWR